MFSVDLEKYFAHNFSDIKEAEKVISCAQYMRNNLTPKDVTRLAMEAFGAPFFMYGSCGILACVLDVLYGTSSSRLVPIVDKKSHEAYKPFKRFSSYTNAQIAVFNSVVDGFAHVYWFHENKYHDIMGQFDDLEFAILSSCEDIDYDEPVAIHLDHKSMRESAFSNHVTIIKGTSGEIEISDLILSIFNKIHISVAA